MKLTPRDTKLLRWINSVGFATIDLIAESLGIARKTAYGRAHKLVRGNYLTYESFMHGFLGSYRASLEGAKTAGSPLPPLRQINRHSYLHDLIVTKLSLQLQAEHQASFISERVLRHEEGQAAIGRVGHMCDGALVIGDKKIALEVELTKKGQQRRERIMRHYLKNFDYQEVWYFCGNAEIEKHMQAFLSSASFLKVFRLDETMIKNAKAFYGY